VVYQWELDLVGWDEIAMTYKYEYKYSKEDGYTKVKIPKRVLKKVMPYRQQWWTVSPTCYVKDSWGQERIEIHLYNSLMGKTVSVLVLPLSIILYGWFESKDSLKRFLFDKKYGAFVTENILEKQKGWELVKEYLPKTIDV